MFDHFVELVLKGLTVNGDLKPLLFQNTVVSNLVFSYSVVSYYLLTIFSWFIGERLEVGPTQQAEFL